MRPRRTHLSLLLALTLPVVSLTSVYADDENEREPQAQTEIDCDDLENVGLPECQPWMPTPPPGSAPSTESAPAGPPPSSAPSSAPSQSTAPSSSPETPPEAQSAGPSSPRDVLLTLADAGKDATQYVNEEKSDARSTWAHARYERRTDSGSTDTFGPRVIDHTVYVAKDAEAAKQIFKDEAGKNSRFPEQNASDARSGSFPWELPNRVDETAAVSACNDCGGKDQIMLHHRIVQRRNNVVSVIYLYGRDKRGEEEITTQNASQMWANKIVERI